MSSELESAGHRPPAVCRNPRTIVRYMELVMKSIIAALTLATLVAALTQPAAAASQTTGADYTQSGPNHTGPLYRGYPLSDWYI
jgi:hypothetical protein